MPPNWSKRMQDGILFRLSESRFSSTGSIAEGSGHALILVRYDTEQWVVPKSMVTIVFGLERNSSESLATRVALEQPFIHITFFDSVAMDAYRFQLYTDDNNS